MLCRSGIFLALVVAFFPFNGLWATHLSAEEARVIQYFKKRFTDIELTHLKNRTHHHKQIIRMLKNDLRRLPTIQLQEVAIDSSLDKVIRINAFNLLQYRASSAITISPHILQNVLQVYERKGEIRIIQVWAGNCLSRWLSKNELNADEKSKLFQIHSGRTVAHLQKKMTLALAKATSEISTVNEVKKQFALLIEKKTNSLLTQKNITGEDLGMLNALMLHAKRIGSSINLPSMIKIIANKSSDLGATLGAIDVLGSIRDKRSWKAITEYYDANLKNYQARNHALRALEKISLKNALRFVTARLAKSQSTDEIEDLERSFFRIGSSRYIERYFEEKYGTLRTALAASPSDYSKWAAHLDESTAATFVEFISATFSESAQSRIAASNLLSLLLSSHNAPHPFKFTIFTKLSSAYSQSGLVKRLDVAVLNAGRGRILHVLRNPSDRSTDLYVHLVAVDALLSGHLQQVSLQTIVPLLSKPRVNSLIANRLSRSSFYDPAKIIKSLPDVLEPSARRRIVRVLEGSGWTRIVEIIAAFDEEIAYLDRQISRSMRPFSKPDPLHEKAQGLQQLLLALINQLPDQAVVGVVDYIVSPRFQQPASVAGDILKSAMSQKTAATIPMLEAMLLPTTSASSRQFITSILFDQGDKSVDEMVAFLRTTSRERLNIIRRFSEDRLFQLSLSNAKLKLLNSAISNSSWNVFIDDVRKAASENIFKYFFGIGLIGLLFVWFRKMIFSGIWSFLMLAMVPVRTRVTHLLASRPSLSLFIPLSWLDLDLFWEKLTGKEMCHEVVEQIVTRQVQSASGRKEKLIRFIGQRVDYCSLVRKVAGIGNDYAFRILVLLAMEEPARLREALLTGDGDRAAVYHQVRNEILVKEVEPARALLKEDGLPETVASVLKSLLNKLSPLNPPDAALPDSAR